MYRNRLKLSDSYGALVFALALASESEQETLPAINIGAETTAGDEVPTSSSNPEKKGEGEG